EGNCQLCRVSCFNLRDTNFSRLANFAISCEACFYKDRTGSWCSVIGLLRDYACCYCCCNVSLCPLVSACNCCVSVNFEVKNFNHDLSKLLDGYVSRRIEYTVAAAFQNASLSSCADETSCPLCTSKVIVNCSCCCVLVNAEK